MKVVIVGGTFDGQGGKVSGVVNKLAYYMGKRQEVELISILNGGTADKLKEVYEGGEHLNGSDVVLWFPNVPNEFEKYRDIKSKYPKKLLVTSKRNFGEYSFQYLINHALGLKSNLVLEFTKSDEGLFQGRLFDPLGTVWNNYDTDFGNVADSLVNRLVYLLSVTRKGTICSGESQVVYAEQEFLTTIQGLANEFHRLITPVETVTRFLGNASFRCRHGFPSFRGDNCIYVSRRNIDKRDIQDTGFVRVSRTEDGKIEYVGDHKPSVDTPIQLRLYENYPKVNYMVHSHVYIKDAPFTEEAVPCGGLEEVDEIRYLYPNRSTTDVAINLIGHGSLVMASSIETLEELASNYYARPLPEVLK